MSSVSQAKYKRRNKRAGLCITCGAKRGDKSVIYCDKHHEQAIANAKARRHRNKQ